MKKSMMRAMCFVLGMIFWMGILSAEPAGKDRFQVEIFGGAAYVDPQDFNLLSEAEEKYNDVFFIQRLLYMEGYFVNDLPQIRSTLPFGIRLKFLFSEKLSFSLCLEGFSRRAETSVEGTFRYVQPTWSEILTKGYEPYRLELSGYSILAGVHYRIPVGSRIDLEIGVAGGWAEADFTFSSTWSHRIRFLAEGYWDFSSVDGGTLEGQGSGNGFVAQAMIRLGQTVWRSFGFFVEGSGTFCRMGTIEGSGREARIGIPGETSWEGTWGIKREEVEMGAGSASILVPTNFWEGWTGEQRERDFVLNLSGVRLLIGLYVRF